MIKAHGTNLSGGIRLISGETTGKKTPMVLGGCCSNPGHYHGIKLHLDSNMLRSVCSHVVYITVGESEIRV